MCQNFTKGKLSNRQELGKTQNVHEKTRNPVWSLGVGGGSQKKKMHREKKLTLSEEEKPFQAKRELTRYTKISGGG